MINSKYSIFIDENLKTKQIGGLVVDNPHILIESIIWLKNKYHNYDEIKYTELSKYNIEFCKSIINLLWIYKFNYYIMDFDKIKIFSYEDFVWKIISEYDNMYVFLDYFSNSW